MNDKWDSKKLCPDAYRHTKIATKRKNDIRLCVFENGKCCEKTKGNFCKRQHTLDTQISYQSSCWQVNKRDTFLLYHLILKAFSLVSFKRFFSANIHKKNILWQFFYNCQCRSHMSTNYNDFHNDFLAIFKTIPIPDIAASKANPPYEIKGRGTPVRGNNAVCAPRLIIICMPKNAAIPPARSLPNGSFESVAMVRILHMRKAKRRITTKAPINPNSSAMIAKIESVVFSGR